MLGDFGRISTSCAKWGIPLLAMVYARGPKISNGYDPRLIAHCARVGVELGADIVKVPYTGDVDDFAEVVQACCVPVVIAGGERMESTAEFLHMVHDSLRAGGAGLSVGRNVFQHPRRVDLVRAVRALVHEDCSVERALAIVGE
jgi:class I fructose-bisphosphate aldolase